MSTSQTPVEVRNADGSFAFLADDDQARQILRSKYGRMRGIGRRGDRHILLTDVAISRGANEIMGRCRLGGTRYVFREKVGDGMFPFTLCDLPGIGIRLRGEKRRPMEQLKLGATLYGRAL